ncbi:MAG: hypothetical protein U1D35_06255 [Paracoccaceae bacterium]|nr:hypothetical protein [Paracoccaceae bacterium]
MFRLSRATIALTLLSACDPAYTPPPEVARVGGYPVFATPYGWKIRSGADVIVCRKNTETDCYWSLRNFQSARIKQDDMQ